MPIEASHHHEIEDKRTHIRWHVNPQAGDPVLAVFSHGFASWGGFFNPLIECLSSEMEHEGKQLIAVDFDYPGGPHMGREEQQKAFWKPEIYGLREQVGFFSAMLQHIVEDGRKRQAQGTIPLFNASTPTVIVGHSAGARTVLDYFSRQKSGALEEVSSFHDTFSEYFGVSPELRLILMAPALRLHPGSASRWANQYGEMLALIDTTARSIIPQPLGSTYRTLTSVPFSVTRAIAVRRLLSQLGISPDALIDQNIRNEDPRVLIQQIHDINTLPLYSHMYTALTQLIDTHVVLAQDDTTVCNETTKQIFAPSSATIHEHKGGHIHARSHASEVAGTIARIFQRQQK